MTGLSFTLPLAGLVVCWVALMWAWTRGDQR